MITKSLTQNRGHRTHTQIDSDIGRAELVDDHPLITCTPQVLEGRAHITATKVPIDHILHGLLQERGHSELTLSGGERASATEVRAAVNFAIDTFLNISRVYAELTRLSQGMLDEKKKKKRPVYARHTSHDSSKKTDK